MPPKLPGKNTATREYYTANPTTDSASNEEIDWPSGDEGLKTSPKTSKSPKTPSSSSKNPTSAKSPSSAKKSSKGKEAAEGGEESGEGQEGGKDETPSPTPSDVVLNADFRDVGELAKENERMMREGVGERQRKARLEGMKDSLEERREEKMGGGKGKGKKKDDDDAE